MGSPKKEKFDWKWSGVANIYIDPRGMFNLFWLGLMSAVVLYNAWVIPLRFFFPYLQEL
jgi:hypothetical protein